jgi:hypothetical protein
LAQRGRLADQRLGWVGAQRERDCFLPGDNEPGRGAMHVHVGQVVLVEFRQGVAGQLVRVLGRAGEEHLVAGVRGQCEQTDDPK